MSAKSTTQTQSDTGGGLQTGQTVYSQHLNVDIITFLHSKLLSGVREYSSDQTILRLTHNLKQRMDAMDNIYSPTSSSVATHPPGFPGSSSYVAAYDDRGERRYTTTEQSVLDLYDCIGFNRVVSMPSISEQRSLPRRRVSCMCSPLHAVGFLFNLTHAAKRRLYARNHRQEVVAVDIAAWIAYLNTLKAIKNSLLSRADAVVVGITSVPAPAPSVACLWGPWGYLTPSQIRSADYSQLAAIDEHDDDDEEVTPTREPHHHQVTMKMKGVEDVPRLITRSTRPRRAGRRYDMHHQQAAELESITNSMDSAQHKERPIKRENLSGLPAINKIKRERLHDPSPFSLEEPTIDDGGWAGMDTALPLGELRNMPLSHTPIGQDVMEVTPGTWFGPNGAGVGLGAMERDMGALTQSIRFKDENDCTL